jgi:hypothetical protein
MHVSALARARKPCWEHDCLQAKAAMPPKSVGVGFLIVENQNIATVH